MNNFKENERLPSGLKKSWLVWILVIAGLMILSLASTGFINNQLTQMANREAADKQTASLALLYTPDKQAKIEGADNGWAVFGATQPKVTIVVFGDFTCPYCREDFPIVRAIMTKHADTVKFIWRDRTPSERSLVLALVAHCAGEQGKFWPMHDRLYQVQTDSLGNSAADLINLGQAVNLDLDKFRLCLTSQKYLDKIRQNTAASFDLGVGGTPTFFINGQKYEGTLAEADFETIISEYR